MDGGFARTDEYTAGGLAGGLGSGASLGAQALRHRPGVGQEEARARVAARGRAAKKDGAECSLGAGGAAAGHGAASNGMHESGSGAAIPPADTARAYRGGGEAGEEGPKLRWASSSLTTQAGRAAPPPPPHRGNSGRAKMTLPCGTDGCGARVEAVAGTGRRAGTIGGGRPR
jgi:hypothetical protein